MLGALSIAADGQNNPQVELGIDVIGRDFQNILENFRGGLELAEPDKSPGSLPEDLRAMNASGRVLGQSDDVAWPIHLARRADALFPILLQCSKITCLGDFNAIPVHRSQTWKVPIKRAAGSLAIGLKGTS